MNNRPSFSVSNIVSEQKGGKSSPEMRSKKVLLCGHRSFAAQGLAGLLEEQEHQVISFSRGVVKHAGKVVTGPVLKLHENPHLEQPFDTVINYIIIKDGDIQANRDYVDSLLEYCSRNKVRHLIHISSMSVYPATVLKVDESAEMESNPSRKGAYGSLKVATDLHLQQKCPENLKLTFVRPGFILGKGLVDPIVGMAFRTPWNHLLLFGNSKNVVPVISREIVHQSIARSVNRPPETGIEALLLADPQSPTRKEWLQECCLGAGCGKSVLSFPSWFWRLAAVGGETVSRILRMGMDIYKPISAACRVQQYNTDATAQRLGINLSIDWRDKLRHSMDDQQPNFKLPYQNRPWNELKSKKIIYLGFGRVVQSLHLPIISKLGYRGSIDAFDLEPMEDVCGHQVRSIEDWSEGGADLSVVATPGPVHATAIKQLEETQGPVLIEKPLCYRQDELDQWLEFASRRHDPVSVCHNYRFKDNVAAMMDHLGKYNPGRLLHVHLHFQSPSVRNESASWLRDERRARTLLMDYSIHMLDLACMFEKGDWICESVRHEIDDHGHTRLIEGRLRSEQYSVSFILRQGFMPRRARLTYTFRNYQTSLGFFPETFVPWMTHDSPVLFGAEKRALAKATRAKIVERLTGRKIDNSHAYAYLAATGQVPELSDTISLNRLRSFYEMIFELSNRVYDS